MTGLFDNMMLEGKVNADIELDVKQCLYKDFFILLKTATDVLNTKCQPLKFPFRASSFKSIILNKLLKPSHLSKHKTRLNQETSY